MSLLQLDLRPKQNIPFCLCHTAKLTLKPFLKWVGGKGQLLELIRSNFPIGMGINFTKYAEPFVGGGAVLFSVLSKYNLDEIYISDINRDLINAYEVIKESVLDLIDYLKYITNYFYNLKDEDKKDYFYYHRNLFNKNKTEVNITNKIQSAGLFIFLNKTCFNGLYRLNNNSSFNVSFGTYKKPNVYDVDNMKLISKKLSNVNIIHGSYIESEDFIDEKTFTYLDPPYRPLSSASYFKPYTEYHFDDSDQIALANFFKKLHQNGCPVLLSNSDPKNNNLNDNFFDDLYHGFVIKRVKAIRIINSNINKRGQISELLIKNY